MTPSATRRARKDLGQSLVEFALVMPIFMLLVVAVFDLGRGVFSYTAITNAAREGARLAVVNQGTALITQRATDQTLIAETSTPNVTVEFRLATPHADYLANAVCTTITLDCVAVVTYQTTYRPVTPIISNLVFPLGVTLQARSIQQVEYVCPNALITSAASCPKQP